MFLLEQVTVQLEIILHSEDVRIFKFIFITMK